MAIIKINKNYFIYFVLEYVQKILVINQRIFC